MQEHMQVRLDELRREFEVGQDKLRDLEAQESQVRQTVLRISGAIQVLEELLAAPSPDEQNGERPVNEGLVGEQHHQETTA